MRQWVGRVGAGCVLLTLGALALGCAQMPGLTSVRGEGRSFEDLMRSGDRYRESGDIERAQVAYLRAWQREPDHPLARVRLAQLQLLHDPARAAASFRSVLAFAPDEVRAFTGLGVAALALGRLEEAEEAFAEACLRADGSALAHAGRAVALDLLGRSDAANEELARARELRPDDAWLLNNVGVSRLLAEDWSGAEAALHTALAMEPDDHTARNNLGLALGRQQRYAEAFAAFGAFGGAGEERVARNNLGYVYFLNERYAEAVEQYELALAAEGADARAVLANLNAALDAMESAPGGAGRRASR